MLDCYEQNGMCDEALNVDAEELGCELEVAQHAAQLDEVRVEQDAHEEWGFYVPTREELMDTTGEFFLHLMLERE